MDLGPPELIIVVVLILVLFGGSQLPKLAKNLGKAQAEFKQAMSGKDKPAEAEAKVTDATDGTVADTSADLTETAASNVDA